MAAESIRRYDKANQIAVKLTEMEAKARSEGRLPSAENEEEEGGLAAKLKRSPVHGSIGLGHTRWATHGPATDENAHPHIGGDKVVAVVHNHSPSVIPFGVSTTPLRPLYHMSAFLGSSVPVFDIRKASAQHTDMLVRDEARKMDLLRVATGDPRVRNIEISAPTLDDLYAHFLQENAA